MGEPVRIVEMMYQTNILLVVLESDPSTVVIWDDTTKKFGRNLKFNSEIKSLRSNRDLLVVNLETSAFIFNFELMQFLHSSNFSNSICGISTA